MRNISWCPCLNTRLNLNIGINYVERAVVFLEFTYIIRLNVEFGNMKQANTTFPFFTALVNGRGHSYTHIRQQKPRLCRRSSSSRGRWSRRSSSNNNTYCSLLSTKKVNFIQFSLESWVFFSSKFRKYILLWLP